MKDEYPVSICRSKEICTVPTAKGDIQALAGNGPPTFSVDQTYAYVLRGEGKSPCQK